MNIVFRDETHGSFVLSSDVEERTIEGVIQALKNGLPEEARRVDVLCHIFDKMKKWAETQPLKL